MSRIVAGLKRSGLAKIETDANDARRIRVRVTRKGERLLQQARRRRIQIVAESLSDLGATELETVRRTAEIIDTTLRARPLA
jgi:DNA-binding MarR family transcriptional regulator